MRNLLFVFLIILSSSCSKVLYDINYKGEDNYKMFYLVDTIIIESPVRVFSEKYGGMFVLSSEKLKQYRNDISFFMEPDVFLLGFDLYRDLDVSNMKAVNYPDNGGCELIKSDIVIEGLEIYEYPITTKFLLGLINTNSYHVKHNSPDYFNIPIKHSKSVYHKMVYPLCK
ncbi:MAG: hypothetical protein ACK5ND_12835 [Bacteroides sp.]